MQLVLFQNKNKHSESCYFVHDLSYPIKEIHLHGISDASQSAYAAYIYLKSETQCRNFAVTVVTAKSRVSLKSCLLSQG